MLNSSHPNLIVPAFKTLHLVSGGARSGKSRFAVNLALQNGHDRLFIATAQAFDAEMQTRILLHQNERRDDFRTLEAPLDLHIALDKQAACDVIVIDCLTLWLSNLVHTGLNDQDIQQHINLGLQAALAKARKVILVSNEIGFGIVPDDALARRFRDLNGRLQQDIGAAALEIHLAALGVILPLKQLARLAAQSQI